MTQMETSYYWQAVMQLNIASYEDISDMLSAIENLMGDDNGDGCDAQVVASELWAGPVTK